MLRIAQQDQLFALRLSIARRASRDGREAAAEYEGLAFKSRKPCWCLRRAFLCKLHADRVLARINAAYRRLKDDAGVRKD